MRVPAAEAVEVGNDEKDDAGTQQDKIPIPVCLQRSILDHCQIAVPAQVRGCKQPRLDHGYYRTQNQAIVHVVAVNPLLDIGTGLLMTQQFPDSVHKISSIPDALLNILSGFCPCL